MPIANGTRFGSYEIQSLIGAGGMGEVYRARDLTLGRTVAIKVLPPEVADDEGRLRRLQREAQVLAALNHPHIGQIYGVVDSSSTRGLVLELVEGESLGANALSVREALTLARQIADALDAAHAHGIVHRDLKPANVKVTPAGVVKVLDFGIAKTVEPPADAAESPTRTATVIGGTLVGTPAYMSPEQAGGLPVDKRTDVWAFGCVLYELLAGRKAFEGPTVTETLASVLGREPDWTALPADTPPAIRSLLQRCLRKDAGERLRDMGDVRLLIDDALAVGSDAGGRGTDVAQGVFSRTRVPVIAAAVVAAVVIAAGATIFLGREPPAETTRLSVSTSVPIVPQLSAAISPDGRQVAFVAGDRSGKSMLWVRALDATEGREIPGTEGALHPFWSPDNRHLGFVAGGKLKRVDISSGTVHTLADTNRGGGTWSRDDVILFTRGFRSGLWTISAGGGTPTQVTAPDESAGELTHAWPHFLPDGRHFLYFSQNGNAERRGVYVGSLDSTARSMLVASDFKAQYAPPGYLLFVRDEALMAQAFDADRLKLGGEPALVADGIWVANGAGQAAFSASQTGVITYVNASMWNTQLAWFDRKGQLLRAVGPPDRYAGQTPEISPDGSRIAVARGPWSREDVWILGGTDGSSRRLTFDPGFDPAWSPDGSRILFRTREAPGMMRLSTTRADGGGSEQLVIGQLRRFIRSLEWSRDGRFVVYWQADDNGLPDLWVLPLDGERRPVPFLQTPFIEYAPQVSPDGRWLAYTSNETGREEVYVQRFPEGGKKRQISYETGSQPRWRGDGKELYYLTADARMMAVRVSASAVFEAGPAEVLFQSRIPAGEYSASQAGHLYDVTSDGQRFLANVTSTELGPPISVITNWMAAFKNR